MTKLPRIFHGKDILALKKRYTWREGLTSELCEAIIFTVPIFGYWIEADSLLFKQVSSSNIYSISKQYTESVLIRLKSQMEAKDTNVPTVVGTDRDRDTIYYSDGTTINFYTKENTRRIAKLTSLTP